MGEIRSPYTPQHCSNGSCPYCYYYYYYY